MKCWSSIISSHWYGKLCKLKNEMHFCRSSRGYCGRRKHFYKRSCFQKWRFDSVGVSSATGRQKQFLTSLENRFDHSQSRHTARRCQVGHCCWCLKRLFCLQRVGTFIYLQLNVTPSLNVKVSRRSGKVETQSAGFWWLGPIHAIRESTAVQ